ncbi:MAG: c-type cytochrome, partial [Planctomycetes bacterium]|nr:c-type cytochrome [Planctomycetota bacterium]
RGLVAPEGLFDYGRTLWRNKATVLIAALLGALAGFLFSLPQTPIYRGRTTLEIETFNENYLNLREVSPTTATSRYATEFDISTQVKILESESLLTKVVEKLKLHERPEFAYQAGRLSVWRKALGLPPAAQVPPLERAIEIALDPRMPDVKRIEAVEALGEVGGPPAIEPLLELIGATEPQPLRLAALDAVARFDDERIATVLVEKLSAMEPALVAKTCDVLLARKAWAFELLERVDRGEFAAEDISLDQLRIVALHKDDALDALVKKHWGTIHSGTPEERLAEMRRINNDLRAGQGNPVAGKALFAKHCGTCHRLFGEGNEIGPELTHANRKNTAELLATMVDPSAVIRREYSSFLVQTTDGRVLSGLLVEQTPGSVTLLDAKNERTTVAREAIETIRESAASLMPDNILTPLKPQELRDLFRYLQSEPPPKRKDEGRRQKDE